jgi:Na+-driven multidrug efflux pump
MAGVTSGFGMAIRPRIGRSLGRQRREEPAEDTWGSMCIPYIIDLFMLVLLCFQKLRTLHLIKYSIVNQELS